MILNLIKRCINRFRYRRFKKNIKKKDDDPIIKNYRVERLGIKKFRYKDEAWNIIKNRWDDRDRFFWGLPIYTNDNDCINDKVFKTKDGFIVDSENLEDDWVWLEQDIQDVSDYSFEFDVVFLSKFTEIQFGIRYVDFYNRYRFRVEDGKLIFDVVSRGQFYNNILSTPFYFEIGKKYSIKIICLGNEFYFYANNKMILGVEDYLNKFKNGGIAIILWDNSGNSMIKANFKNIKFKIINN